VNDCETEAIGKALALKQYSDKEAMQPSKTQYGIEISTSKVRISKHNFNIRTNPSSGQASINYQLCQPKLPACHSGAAFEAWPGFLLQKQFWWMRRWVPGADGWGPAWWRHGEMERARGRIGSLRFSATSCSAQQLNA
jgi:hypothetical protein